MTTSLDDVKTSSHAAHIINVGPATVSRVEYFTLWMTKSHFSVAQTSLKQLFICWCCIVSTGWNTQLSANVRTNFCRSVYSGMMQQILPTGRHCAHYIFCIVYCIVLYWWSCACKVGAFYDETVVEFIISFSKHLYQTNAQVIYLWCIGYTVALLCLLDAPSNLHFAQNKGIGYVLLKF